MPTTRANRIWPLLAIAVGLLCAVVALHSSDLQFAVAFLFIQCVVFGFAQPAKAWRWACLIAMWIPLSLLLNAVITIPGPREIASPARLFLGPLVVFFRSTEPVTLATVPASAISLLPALAGSYFGAWMNS